MQDFPDAKAVVLQHQQTQWLTHLSFQLCQVCGLAPDFATQSSTGILRDTRAVQAAVDSNPPLGSMSVS
jgi:hypothetical protein